MRTKLIVLIDFSPYSETLLQLASTWSKAIDAVIVLVHKTLGVTPTLADSASSCEIIELEKQEALADLAALAQKFCADTIKITCQVFEKSLLSSLPLLLKQNFHNLILAGLKGTGLLKQIVLGSTALHIIEDLNLALIAVPVKTKPFFPDKIIVALNYRYPLNEHAFLKILAAFQNSITQLEFIAIVTPKDSEAESHCYLKQVNNTNSHDYAASYQVFKGEDAFMEVKAYVQKTQKSILAVQKGSRTLTDQLFRKFLINDLVHDGSIPLIVVPS